MTAILSKRVPQHMLPVLVPAFWLILSAAAHAAEPAFDKLLPAPACADGWVMDGKVQLFDRDSLFDRINGEAELYLPYGFERLAYARYESAKDPKVAVDADVYVMGSPLDAFGIYASYRRKDAAEAGIGVEGTVTPSQLLFYQDRYLVRLQVTGATTLGQEVFRACGTAVAGRLPKPAGPPPEIEALRVPGVIAKSERYISQSLLGYEFFTRGFIADAALDSGQVQVFLVPERTPDAARLALAQYRSYLKAPGTGVLESVDPLYGGVVVEQEGRYLIGVVRAKDARQAKQLIGQVRGRLGRK